MQSSKVISPGMFPQNEYRLVSAKVSPVNVTLVGGSVMPAMVDADTCKVPPMTVQLLADDPSSPH